MTVTTSSSFACVAKSGTDWRDTSKKVLEALQGLRTDEDHFSLGFIYITPELAGQAANILDLFRSITGVQDWVGSVSKVIFDIDKAYTGVPAISVMLARFAHSDYLVTPGTARDPEYVRKSVETWLTDNDPQLCFLHGYNNHEFPPKADLNLLSEMTESFLIGALPDMGPEGCIIANQILEENMSGALLSSAIPLVTAISQGYRPISDKHKVTRAHDKFLMEIDHRPALEVLQSSCKNGEVEESAAGTLGVGVYIQNSDLEEYLVREITEIDQEKGWLGLRNTLNEGTQICFVKQDAQIISEQLSRMVLRLRERFQRTFGDFEPKAGIYIHPAPAGNTQGDPGAAPQLIREILGQVPLIGFQSKGEISNARLYEHANILILLN